MKVCSEDSEGSEGGYPANRADCSEEPGARATSRTTLCLTVCVVIIRVLSYVALLILLLSSSHYVVRTLIIRNNYITVQ